MRNFNFSVWELFLLSALIIVSCDKEVSVTPEDSPASSGRVVINSNPQGAEIFINDDNTGKLTPDSIIHLEPGVYHVKMRLYPYLDIIDSVIIEETVPKFFTADFYGDTRNFGTITINSEPTGAEIFLRDSCLNLKTPAVINQLWPGLYNIACTYPEHRKKSTYVLVRGGEQKSGFITLQDTSVCVDYNPANSDFPSIQTNCISVDHNNFKWVGLPGTGLARYTASETILYNAYNSELPHNYVTCIEVDNQNRKWIGTHAGLVVIDNGNWTVYTTGNSSIPHDHITAITFDSRGNAWIGASDPIVARLLIKFDGANWSSYDAGNIIVSLAADHNDRIWVGLNNGFRIFDNENWINIVPELVNTHHLAGNPIESIAVDLDGRVWVAAGGVGYGFTYIPGGLYVFENDDFTRVSLPEDLISQVQIAPNGNKWISCLGKYPLNYVEDTRVILIKIDPEGNLTSYSKNSSDIPAGLLKCSFSQSNGDLWIASRDKGIIKFKSANL